LAQIGRRMLTRLSLLSIACFGLAILAPLSAPSQVLYGTLLGNVSGPDGQAIPKAKLKLHSPDTGLAFETTGDARGEYAFRDLAPGIYSLEISADGFAASQSTGIPVRVNTAARVDVTLSIAAQQERVEVVASADAIQTDSGDLHAELTSRQIENLPMNGYRNYQSLLNLVPGATPARYQNSVMDTPARSLTTNVNGTTRNGNATSVDGASIQQVYLPHHTLYNPPADDIESVNVATNSFSAEQGLAGGAAITVITKSGTNQFHGAAFEDHTNSALAARNFFYLRNNVPLNLLNQFGATLGGPIRKNRLFFFSSYEGVIQRQNYSEILTLPNASERNANFGGLATIYDPATGNPDGSGRTPFAGNIIPADRLSPQAGKMLALAPAANLQGTANNYFVGANYGLDRHSLDEKVTWQTDSKSSLFAKYTYMDAQVSSASSLGAGGGTGLSPGGSNSGSGFSHMKVTVLGVGYTRTLAPNFIVDGNFGFGRNVVDWTENDYGKNYGTDLLGIPGTNGSDPRQSGLPSFAISGFETFGNPDAYTPEIKRDNVFTYVANAAWSHGSHTIRFGVQTLNNRMIEFQPQRGFGPRGGFTFNGGATSLKGGAASTSANAFADFLLGLPNTLGKSYQFLDPIAMNEWQDGIYAQDQWRVTPGMTLTLGVRWEYYPIPGRDTRGLERYDFTTNSVILGGLGNHPAGAGASANPHQFVPRLGVAYRINDKTVLRGGFGMTIDPYPFSRAMRDPYPVTIAQTLNSTSSYVPVGSLTTGIPAVSFPNLSSGTVSLPLDAYTKTLEPGEFTRGNIQSFNFTLERELGAGFTLSAGYVGTRSLNQMAYIEGNAGQVPGAGSAGQPLYIAFGRATQTQIIEPFQNASYNSLQVFLRRRLLAGVSLTAAYTYGKSIDYSTDSDSTPYFNAIAYIPRDRAVSDFDRTHVFQSGFTAEAPFGAGHRWATHGLASAIFGGWQLNGIFAKFSGLPFTPTASGTSLNQPFNTQVADQINPQVAIPGGIGTGATWFDTSAYAPVTQARLGTAGRNSLRGPGDTSLDLGLARRFTLREWLRLEFRAEAFNVSNTPSFANPSGNASSGTFGHITSTAGSAADSRVIRFSGKFTF
jgi:Carboxypeptidase regulatory-like domain/TonB dependent receptor/TonB-dependent Receptor Plug Domain